MRDRFRPRFSRGAWITPMAVALAMALLLGAAPAPASAGWPPPVLPRTWGGLAWGANDAGQIGDRSTTNRFVATYVYGMPSGPKQVAAGSSHSLVLTEDGSVWGWGDNSFGQVGNGSNFPYGQPERVVGLTDVVQIAASGTTSMALRSDGTVWAWGANFSGKLGDGTTTHRNVPVQVAGLYGVTRIAAGGLHGLALKSDGTVWAWGDSSRGQLGGGNWYGRLTADAVPGLAGVTRIAAGYRHNIALLSDGSVRTWGDNTWGLLGIGSSQPAAAQPVTPIGLESGVAGIAAGWRHNMACTDDGYGYGRCRFSTLYAWGNNADGQLGDGTYVSRNRPTVIDIYGVVDMYLGFGHSVLLVPKPLGGEQVQAAGANWAGQLGDNTGIRRSTFGDVPYLGSPKSIAAGDHHSVAVALVVPLVST